MKYEIVSAKTCPYVQRVMILLEEKGVEYTHTAIDLKNKPAWFKEVKRQLDVLDRQLAEHPFIAGNTYSIADIAIVPWYGVVVQNLTYDAAEFLEAHTYTNVLRWTDAIWQRPAVQRGLMVNNVFGPLEEQLHERHDASDFERKTQDKLVKDSAER